MSSRSCNVGSGEQQFGTQHGHQFWNYVIIYISCCMISLSFILCKLKSHSLLQSLVGQLHCPLNHFSYPSLYCNFTVSLLRCREPSRSWSSRCRQSATSVVAKCSFLSCSHCPSWWCPICAGVSFLSAPVHWARNWWSMITTRSVFWVVTSSSKLHTV